MIIFRSKKVKIKDMDFEVVSNSVEETTELGRRFGSQLRGGEIVALIGPLGSGKTHFVKGVAAGAGAEDSRVVNSPTFVIVNEYSGRLDIYHVDAYRINSVDEFEMLGFDDFCYDESVVLIEWADKVIRSLKGADYICEKFSHESETKKKIILKNLTSYIEL